MAGAVSIASAALLVAGIPAGQATHASVPVVQECLKARVPLAVDATPATENFETAACPNHETVSALRYDVAHGAMRLTRAIAAGEVVRSYPGYRNEAVHPGEVLQLVIAFGPVRVARTVEAMQSAAPGQRLFVKAKDGAIFSVRYEEAAP